MNWLVFAKTEESKNNPIPSITCLIGNSERKMKGHTVKIQYSSHTLSKKSYRLLFQ